MLITWMSRVDTAHFLCVSLVCTLAGFSAFCLVLWAFSQTTFLCNFIYFFFHRFVLFCFVRIIPFLLLLQPILCYPTVTVITNALHALSDNWFQNKSTIQVLLLRKPGWHSPHYTAHFSFCLDDFFSFALSFMFIRSFNFVLHFYPYNNI